MKRFTWLVAAILGMGCGGGTDESVPQVLEVGAYDYTFGSGPERLVGTLHVTYADADSLVTYLEVPGMDSATSLNFWNVDAYVIYGYPDEGGIAATRIWRTKSGTRCEGRYIDLPLSVEMDCRVSFNDD